MIRWLRFLLPVGLALAFSAGCSGPGFGFGGGQRLTVGLYDGKNDVHLELANESQPDFEDVYSRRRADASLKLAPDDLMGDLVGDLQKLGFEALSKVGVPPGSATLDLSTVGAGGQPSDPAKASEAAVPLPPGGIRGWVTITRGDSTRTFVVPAAGASADQLQSFVSMKLVVDYYYSHVSGLQFVNNPEGHRIFQKAP